MRRPSLGRRVRLTCTLETRGGARFARGTRMIIVAVKECGYALRRATMTPPGTPYPPGQIYGCRASDFEVLP